MSMPSAATSSLSRISSTSHLNITPRSSWYSVPASTWIVARGSRSTFLTFCEAAYVHDHSSPLRTTYQSGIRCGQPSRPLVAQMTVRCSSRKARTSSSDIWICSRRLTSRVHGEARDRRADRLARVLWLEHGGVAGLLEDLAGEEVAALVAVLDDDRAVGELLGDAVLLAGPPGALGRDPHARHARRLDLPGPRPALDGRLEVDLRARREDRVGHARGAHAVEAEVAQRVALRVERGDVPALAPVDELVGLDAALGELVLVGLVVVELDQAAAGDGLRDDRGDLGVVRAGGGDLQPGLRRVLAERGDDLLARGREGALRDVLADEV